MKREELIAKGYSEEQVTEILNMYHSTNKAQTEEIANLQKDLANKSEYETKYKEVQSQLDAINQEKMTEQEKIAKDREEADKYLANAKKINNTAKAKSILAQTGLQGEELDKLVDSIVRDDETATIDNANLFLNTFNTMKDNTAKATKEELINTDTKPNMSNAPQDNVMTFDAFRSLTVEEQNKFAQEHPEEFANL